MPQKAVKKTILTTSRDELMQTIEIHNRDVTLKKNKDY